ncbi:ATP-binding protein [Clostridium rectalis]|uniref:ATP-binding protein n=1 Tax=Clostridium rectalis TaxID=2040295 RepID=UPI000F63E456|nr:ATP-binding protein [Clostridium rectalis]
MTKNYQQEVLKIYSMLRDKEEKALQLRRAEIEEKVPEIIGIENQIAKLSLDMSLNIIKRKDNLEKYINNTKEKITDLRVRKSELLVSYGYPLNYLEFNYKCTKCKDTGFIGTKKCKCFKYNLNKILYNNSELGCVLKKDNFSNFNFNFFSPQKSPQEPKSPRKNMEEIVSKCWSFIDNFQFTEENLLFYGSSGTGKSFLSNCIAKELLDKGYMVVYRTAVDLITDLKQIRFNSDIDLEDLLINCDLLIIDDLGTEPLSEFSKSEFFNLLNRKLLKRKKMIISTNFRIEELLKTYSERVSSRLFGNFTLHKFFGDDVRVKLNFKG